MISAVHASWTSGRRDEAYVLRALRDRGMPLADIRKAAAIVRTEFDDPYALASRRIATDGVAVFVRLADDSLIHARDKQGAIREVLDEYRRCSEWSDGGSPKLLKLPQYPTCADVAIDPRFSWGAPVLAQNKVKIDDIVALWRAGESITQVTDEDWISEGCRRGWVLLTKDRRIRYRAQELAALQDGFLFCLADGNANLDLISATWIRAMPAIGRAVSRGATGFWHVYRDGSIKRMWP